MTEDEMVGWHHRLDGHEFEQAPGVGDGQGSLACCSLWGHKESDTTERLNKNDNMCLEKEGWQEWRRDWQPTPAFLPGRFHGQRSPVGYSPWGGKESDTTEHLTLY